MKRRVMLKEKTGHPAGKESEFSGTVQRWAHGLGAIFNHVTQLVEAGGAGVILGGTSRKLRIEDVLGLP